MQCTTSLGEFTRPVFYSLLILLLGRDTSRPMDALDGGYHIRSCSACGGTIPCLFGVPAWGRTTSLFWGVRSPQRRLGGVVVGGFFMFMFLLAFCF